MSLDGWRKRLNTIDSNILNNIQVRDEIVAEIAQAKLEKIKTRSLSAFEIVRPDREKEVLNRMMLDNSESSVGGALVYEIWRRLITRAYKGQGIKTIEIMGDNEVLMNELNKVALIHYGAQMIYQQKLTRKLTAPGSASVLAIFGVKNLLNSGECWWKEVWDDKKRMFVRDCLPQVRVNYSEQSRQNSLDRLRDIAWDWQLEQHPFNQGRSQDIAPYWLVTDFSNQNQEAKEQTFDHLERLIMVTRGHLGSLEKVIVGVEQQGGLLLSQSIDNEDSKLEHAMFLLAYDKLDDSTLRVRELEDNFISKWGGGEGFNARLLGGYSLPIDIDEERFFGFS